MNNLFEAIDCETAVTYDPEQAFSMNCWQRGLCSNALYFNIKENKINERMKRMKANDKKMEAAAKIEDRLQNGEKVNRRDRRFLAAINRKVS